MHLKRLVIFGILGTGLLTGLGLAASARDVQPPAAGPAIEPVGLSLLFQNGAMAPT